jgi:hypothetical protein
VNPFGKSGDRSEQHFWRADGEVGPVVLAHAEEVDADLVSQLAFGEYVPQDPPLGKQTALGVDSDIAEGIEAQFYG